jgi:hypothetical protein
MGSVFVFGPQPIKNSIVSKLFEEGNIKLAFALAKEDRQAVIQRTLYDRKISGYSFSGRDFCIIKNQKNGEYYYISWSKIGEINFWDDSELLKLAKELFSRPHNGLIDLY